MKVIFERINDFAILPTFGSEEAAGMDLYAVGNYTIKPHEVVKIRTGLKMQLPKGFEGQLRPRSGMSTKKREGGARLSLSKTHSGGFPIQASLPGAWGLFQPSSSPGFWTDLLMAHFRAAAPDGLGRRRLAVQPPPSPGRRCEDVPC